MNRAKASAPGKLILFGEHAVVYGRTAVAAALSSLRVAVDAELIDLPPTQSRQAELRATLVDLKAAKGDGSCITLNLPLSALARALPATLDWRAAAAPDENTLSALSQLLSHLPEEDQPPLLPVLFLVAALLPQLLSWSCTSLQISVRSAALPVGAGLGSSAAFSVALSAALLKLQLGLQLREGGQNLSIAPLYEGDDDAVSQHPLGSTSAPSRAARQLINDWAYASECILHGRPSGLDNAVSCHGGCVRLSKDASDSSGRLIFEDVGALPPIQVLVINTRAPRKTRELVARVRTLYEAYPFITQPILDAIAATSEAFLALAGNDCVATEERTAATATEIGRLVRLNHGLLCSLGVSASSLERACALAAEEELPSKLTGAGGGGCAYAVVGLGALSAEEVARARRLQRRLEAEGFHCYNTTVGGDGVLWHEPGTTSPLESSRLPLRRHNLSTAILTASIAAALIAWRSLHIARLAN